MMRYLFSLVALVLVASSPALAVTFDHQAHNEYVEGADCSTCHVEGAYSIVPAKTVCTACHEEAFAKDVEYPGMTTHGPLWAFEHRREAQGSNNCASCHEQEFCLECHKSGFADEMGELGNNMANIHRSDFEVTHPIAARTDSRLCASCHESGFCVDCHNSFNRNDLRILSHRRGWSDITVGGTAHADFTPEMCSFCHRDSVLPSNEWHVSHAREARRDLASCQACHPEGEICLNCHSARSGLRVNPHPSSWDDIKGRLESASGGRTCRKCH